MSFRKEIVVLMVFMLMATNWICFATGKAEEKVEITEAAMIKEPVPYPEGKPMPGGREATKFNLDEMLTYKKLPKYSQPKWMDKLVADEVIPPVEKRLPEEPQVYLSSGMSDGPGGYGGIWRDFSAVPTEGWNQVAGQTQGWFGINYIFQESLVKSGPVFMRKDKAEPFPNLAKSWE